MQACTLEKLFHPKTLYVLTTLFIVIAVGFIGGAVDILQTNNVVSASMHLGYPLYFFTLLGIFKILGAIALLLPKRLEQIRLLAYFGFAVDFIFASFSHYSVNDTIIDIAIPLVLLGILAISYLLSLKYSLYQKCSPKEVNKEDSDS